MNFARNRSTAGAVGAYRIVKGTVTDGTIAQSAAAADKHVGVNGPIVSDAAGDRLDIIHAGPVRVQAGGAFAMGDTLTSDANGKAVVGATGNRFCLIALENSPGDGALVDAIIAHGFVP